MRSLDSTVLELARQKRMKPVFREDDGLFEYSMEKEVLDKSTLPASVVECDGEVYRPERDSLSVKSNRAGMR